MSKKQMMVKLPGGEECPVWDWQRTSWVQRPGTFTLADVTPDLAEMLVESAEPLGPPLGPPGSCGPQDTTFQLYDSAGKLLWEGAGLCTFDPDENGSMLDLNKANAPWKLVMPDNSGVVFTGVGRYPLYEKEDS